MWKDIKGFESDYKINEFGKVYSLKSNKILSQSINIHGYYMVYLCREGGKTIAKQLHRLIAEAFIPNPENKPCIDHINSIRTDNRIENLRWCTYKENNNNPIFKEKLSTSHIGKKLSKETILKREKTKKEKGGKINRKLNNGNSKPIIQFDLSMNKINIFPSMMEVWRTLKYNPSNISMCCNGKRKSAYGFIWKYFH